MNFPYFEKQHESFNGDFCSFLEYYLCKFFKNSNDDLIKGLWCDGVSLPPQSAITKARVSQTQIIRTKAMIGYNGQTEYDLVLRLGTLSLQKYAEGESLQECLYNENIASYLTINMPSRILELQLK